MINPVEDVKKALHAPKFLKINNVPYKARALFIKLAEEEFGDDFAATLKHLIDIYFYWVPHFMSYEQRISDLEKSIGVIREKKEEDNMIKTVGGRILKRGEIKND